MHHKTGTKLLHTISIEKSTEISTSEILKYEKTHKNWNPQIKAFELHKVNV
jgi:hypothetical protein